MRSRKTPPSSFYLDMTLLGRYWSCFPEEQSGSRPRMYHHTAPVSAMYALREGLAQLAEEGLQKAWERHRKAAEGLWKGPCCQLAVFCCLSLNTWFSLSPKTPIQIWRRAAWSCS